jgi:hypothetical protein
MKIGLYNLEPKFTNIALEKVRRFYQGGGHFVSECTALDYKDFDKVYCFSLFDFTQKDYVAPEMECGGTGFKDLISKQLPKEIDSIELHINRGFTTRGCPNKCKFCVVPIKEGDIKIVGTVLDLWDKKSKLVTCYDNNILALPEHFALNARLAIENKIKLDYNQGLDHRRLTPEIVEVMKSFSHIEYRFAFDNVKSIDTVDKAITLLQSMGINRCAWYVLCGFDTTMEEDMFRLNYLKSRGQNAYVQRFRNKKNDTDPRLIALARWVNRHDWFQGTTWKEYLDHPDNKGYKKILKAQGFYN